ncbi:MAG: Fe-S cluster assembly ATPase SufC [Armatimonadota bacterium]|nr:Fe-S cluster assembly ATPase SufC [Armatimonadota bacterium]MDR7451409.1 Fe-S cluster assembly ATPase SufC [Armatimonadota bacterium]MDR7466441.1 Fe-S cluster assembly ATPase SufC [Armatimonadota bacterium]MDR7493163.1 Fe-S cluster assembly ATPase SufC [Armatimonadota bacterium]MDR7500352.1 Fe-S cluster assembly ATPase SufC [Armatimonadota bacterium]
MADLEIRDLTVQVEDKVILKGANLSISKGEIHALMGPNGSGKSTLANVLMGNPFYQVVKGEVLYKGEDLLAMSPDERARKGLFIAFQYPVSIPGVTMSSFLRTAVSARRGYDRELMPVGEFQKLLRQKMEELRIEPSIVTRYVNEGFSGGEKKRAEILQMALLEPEIAIMDETDSGLDIDSVKIVADGVTRMFQQAAGQMGILVITHYSRILHFIRPSYVHVMFDGRFVVSGGPELAEELEQSGYEGIKAQFEVIAAEVADEGAVRRAGKVFWVVH